MLEGFVDGSTGYKNGTIYGWAYLCANKYMAQPFPRTDFQKINCNEVEQRAIMELLKAVPDRPLLVYTDSNNAIARIRAKDVELRWVKRRTNLQMRLVDSLSKLAAITNKTYQGDFPLEYEVGHQCVLEIERVMAKAYWYATKK